MPKRPVMFRPAGAQTRQEQSREYDRHRGSARARGYNAAWDNASRGFKRRHPLCPACEAVGIIACTEVVDHVEPHEGDTRKFWDKTMWQPACRWHHDVVKQVLERMWKRGEVGLDDLWLTSPTALSLAADLRPSA
jgi:5-methylcytosine-specific restriction enzyme A